MLLDGSRSQQSDVISGAPHGTVMGPLMFLALINDLPESAKLSDPRLFAEDCLLYSPTRSSCFGGMGKKEANEVPP